MRPSASGKWRRSGRPRRDPDTTREELFYTSWGDYGPYWGWGPYLYRAVVWHTRSGIAADSREIDVQKILVGTLTLDMIDARTEKAFLHGTAEDTVSHKAKKNEKKAYEAVAEIFEESPWGADFDDD